MILAVGTDLFKRRRRLMDDWAGSDDDPVVVANRHAERIADGPPTRVRLGRVRSGNCGADRRGRGRGATRHARLDMDRVTITGSELGVVLHGGGRMAPACSLGA